MTNHGCTAMTLKPKPNYPNGSVRKKHTKLLNFEQKQCRMDIAQEMLTTFNDDPYLLKKVITGDES